MSDPIPVLVTDAESMPDFKPGEMVSRLQLDLHGEVAAYPFRDAVGTWRVPVYDAEHIRYWCWPASSITKRPRETSKLVRVTGPEDNAECLVRGLMGRASDYQGVRVEIVEEDDGS